MARIRTVKPGYFTDPDVTAVSIPARLLLVSLWTQADDEGRLLDQPRLMCAQSFGDEDRVNPEKLVAELASGREPRILRYEVAGKRYVSIHGFLNHQVISHPRPSVFPEPSSNPPGGLPEGSTLPEGSSNPPVILREASGGEWNGMEEEWNGMELAPAPRTRDEMFEALAEACDIDWHHLTPSARSALNAATKALREAGDASPDEIRYRRDAYRLTYPSMALTPSALAKHWPSLANGQRATGPTATADRMLARVREMQREEGRA